MNARQFCRTNIHDCVPAVTLTFQGGTERLHWCAEHASDADAYRATADPAPMTEQELGNWLYARGVRTNEDMARLIAANLGRTESEMDAEYDAMHGSMA